MNNVYNLPQNSDRSCCNHFQGARKTNTTTESHLSITHTRRSHPVHTLLLPRRSGNQYTVLDRKRVSGKTLDVPISNRADIHEERDDIEVLRYGNLPKLLNSGREGREQHGRGGGSNVVGVLQTTSYK